MIIILVNLSENMDEHQIEELIKPLVKDCQIVKISILAQKNRKTSIFEFHGLVTIIPDSVARNIIEELINNKINNKYSDVREYQERYGHNDQRVNSNHLKGLNDSRCSDRRRKYSEVFLNGFLSICNDIFK